jgi:hypothetical protein
LALATLHGFAPRAGVDLRYSRHDGFVRASHELRACLSCWCVQMNARTARSDDERVGVRTDSLQPSRRGDGLAKLTRHRAIVVARVHRCVLARFLTDLASDLAQRPHGRAVDALLEFLEGAQERLGMKDGADLVSDWTTPRSAWLARARTRLGARGASRELGPTRPRARRDGNAASCRAATYERREEALLRGRHHTRTRTA